jgi:hypothetical protein
MSIDDTQDRDVQEVYGLLNSGGLLPDRIRLALKLAWNKGMTYQIGRDTAESEAKLAEAKAKLAALAPEELR